MKIIASIILLFSIIGTAQPLLADENLQRPTTRQERNLIREGNKLYREKRFAEAEVLYRKALEAAPASEAATFNLASSLLRQSGSADPNTGNNPIKDAVSLFQGLAQSAQDISIAEKSFYNLGNIAFNQQNYQQSIDMYKNALRRNPDNDKTRQNLRLAQLKLKEQQNQDKNKDNNKDQNQQQDQKQNQNQQDKDKDKDKKDNNQDQNQDKNENKPQQQPQQQTGISDANAEQILKAMEKEEAATRKRVETQKKKNEQARRKRVVNPW